jgi:putative endonuclease
MMYYVYILYSERLSKYYCGFTNDVTRRIEQHNTGQGNFTSKGCPWILINSFNCNTKIEALSLEKKIKKRGIKRFLDDLQSSGRSAAR